MICSTQMEFLKSIAEPCASQFHAREIAAFPTFTPHSSGSTLNRPEARSLLRLTRVFDYKKSWNLLWSTPRLQALGNLIIRVQEMLLGLYLIIGPPTNNCSTEKRQKNLTLGTMTLYLFMKNNNLISFLWGWVECRHWSSRELTDAQTRNDSTKKGTKVIKLNIRLSRLKQE